MWIVSKHEKLHNHELVPPSKSYLLRSHRMVSRNHISYLTDLKSSGVSVANGVRFLKTQSGGSPLVGFTSRDAYNSLCTDAFNKLDGTDSNTLIEIFKRRQSSERDFYFDFEVDLESRMVKTYKCHNNHWIEKLYGCREKWCPAFNKDYFLGGILSSQRSETTNHSISRRLSKTSGLCDFYNSFVGVISEWRSRENGEDVRCSQGVPTMVMDNVKILLHAREIYTIEIYYLFKEQFLKGGSCYQECVMLEDGVYKYHVWRPDVDIIRHEVIFNNRQMDIGCSCKLFTELGILCCHCLRILNVHCVSEVPEKYILNRWTKKVVEVDNFDIMSRVDSGNGASSVWLLEIIRKFQRLAVYSQENIEGRKICEEAIADARRRLEAECGGSLFEECDIGSSSGVIKDPSTRWMKGLRNRRVSSVISKKYNKARGRKHLAHMVASKIKSAVQSQVEDDILNIAGDGYLVHPSSGGSNFCHVSTMSSMEDN
ncbi:PREDICTED: protein FAR1-RELATED SEQUENCE 5-like [Ipomoea nil]|uniref:protein FAR1-RELATED SEQUENCE 5-like n=1 Tax=Ipomoea nil TaxID=35883 RepID=UPI000901ACED|nr:PREDICTED: protein FAR1-RELATED SEQUENCE 5-like [Ipomoea nil]